MRIAGPCEAETRDRGADPGPGASKMLAYWIWIDTKKVDLIALLKSDLG